MRSIPMPARMSWGACGSARRLGSDGVERAETLLKAGVDVIVIDTAHGHSQA